MTTEQLIELAKGTMQFGIDYIRDKGDLSQQFHLVRRDGTMEVVVLLPAITNNEQAKFKFSQMLKARVREGNIVAVIMLSDTWIARNPTPEAVAQKLAERLTVSQGAELGLWAKEESVFCSLESPLLQWSAHQMYKRAGKSIELVGDMIVLSSLDGGQMDGRFSGYWPPTSDKPNA